jgi:hypothetical protein
MELRDLKRWRELVHDAEVRKDYGEMDALASRWQAAENFYDEAQVRPLTDDERRALAWIERPWKG